MDWVGELVGYLALDGVNIVHTAQWGDAAVC